MPQQTPRRSAEAAPEEAAVPAEGDDRQVAGESQPGSAAGRPPRSALTKTVRDVSLSMGIVAAIIAAVMIISWRPQPDPVREVDALPVAQAAATVTKYPVLYPNVGADWRATSARFQPTEESGDEPVWFNGWVTPDGQYVAIVQSAATSRDFVVEQTIDGREPRAGGPAAAVPGWTAWVSRDGEQRSLVRQTRTGTTIVTGTLSWEGLVAFRDSLAPVQR